MEGLSFLGDGTLYGTTGSPPPANTNPNSLWLINTTTAAATKISSLPSAARRFRGIGLQERADTSGRHHHPVHAQQYHRDGADRQHRRLCLGRPERRRRAGRGRAAAGRRAGLRHQRRRRPSATRPTAAATTASSAWAPAPGLSRWIRARVARLYAKHPDYLERDLTANQQYNDADFGLQPPGTGSIGDYVWLDKDNDGVQDAGESGMPNVTVRLYRDLDGNGLYDPGDRRVRGH